MHKDWIKVNDCYFMTKCAYERTMPNGFRVPCGKCYYCRKRYAREMAFRCEQEAFDKYVYNVLLTYDDDHLPHRLGKPTLNKVHFQDFMKRFRSWFDYHNGYKLRYFCVGEYGGKKGRPHYHMILFCENNLADKELDHCEPLSFINQVLNDTWRKGTCDIEPMKEVGGAIRYFVQYLLTHNKDDKAIEPPFRLMSRGKGLGHKWIERSQDFINYANKYDRHYLTKKISENKEIIIPIPRYYKRKYQPECLQIAHADAYYSSCIDYDLYMKEITHNLNESKKYGKEIERRREAERTESVNAYRKAKVHEHGRSASRLFARNAKNRQR